MVDICHRSQRNRPAHLAKTRRLQDAGMIAIVENSAASPGNLKIETATGDLTEKDYFELVRLGQYQIATIQKNGADVYRIFYCIGQNKFLHVAASFAAGLVSDSEAWGLGVETLARKKGCQGVSFVTARLGHIAQAAKWGAQIQGVYMTKKIEI